MEQEIRKSTLIKWMHLVFTSLILCGCVSDHVIAAQLEEQLKTASSKGDLAKVRRFIDAGSNVNQAVEGSYPLHEAAFGGHSEIATVLLAAGARVEVTDIHHKTPLHRAVEFGRRTSKTPITAAEVVKVLLRAKAKVNATDDERGTPLHYAARNGCTEATRLLLQARAKVNARNSDGETPLARSFVHIVRVELAKLLLQFGATFDAFSQEQKDRALHTIIEPTGATCPLEMRIELVETLLREGASLESVNRDGMTPLQAAVSKGLAELVKVLLRAGAQVNGTNSRGEPPLTMVFHAFEYKDSEHEEKAIELTNVLLEAGSSIESADSSGRSALHIAVSKGYSRLVSLLLERGCPVDLATTDGWTPLSGAVAGDHEDLVRILLQAGASSGVVIEGESILEKAVRGAVFRTNTRGDKIGVGPKIVNVLLEYGARVRTPEEGSKLLNIAAYHLDDECAAEVVAGLLKAGADQYVNSKFEARWIYSQLPLYHALDGAKPKLCKVLIEAGARFEELSQGDKDNLLLKMTCYIDEEQVVQIVRMLLAHGADPNFAKRDCSLEFSSGSSRDEANEKQDGGSMLPDNSPLSSAARHCHLRVVKDLIRAGACVDVDTRKGGPLYSAMNNYQDQDCPEVIQALLDAGAQVDTLDKDGHSPLYYAVDCWRACSAALLINRGARIDALSGNLKNKALAFCVIADDVEALKKLLQAGADVRSDECKSLLHQAESAKMVHALLEAGLMLGAKNQGTTELHQAAYDCRTKVVQALLDAGLEVDVRDDDGATPLYTVIGCFVFNSDGDCEAQRGDFVKVLLNAGAKVDATTNREQTPLHAAAEKNYFEIAKVLLDAGANPLATDSEGKTPADSARVESEAKRDDKGYSRIIELLSSYKPGQRTTGKPGKDPLLVSVAENDVPGLASLLLAGAPVDARDDSGKPLLYCAVEEGYRDQAALLVQYGATLSAPVMGRKHEGRTALHCAVIKQDYDLAHMLLFSGANSDCRDAVGNTPLHWAVSKENEALVELLLSYDADANIRNGDGLSAQSLASEKNNQDIIKCLVPRGSRDDNEQGHFCVICQETQQPDQDSSYVCIKECGHVFHTTCSRKLEDECPVCRGQFAPGSLQTLQAKKLAHTQSVMEEKKRIEGQQGEVQQQLQELHRAMVDKHKAFKQAIDANKQDLCSQKVMLIRQLVATRQAVESAREEQLVYSEQRYILASEKLSTFYNTIRSELSKAYIGAQAVLSGSLELDTSSKKSDGAKRIGGVALGIMKKLGGSIPFVSALSDLASSVGQAALAAKLKNTMNKLIAVAPDSTEFNIILELVARRITFALEPDIKQMSLLTYEPGVWKKMKRRLKKYRDLLLANRIDNQIKEEAARCSGTLLNAITHEEINPAGDRVRQMFDVICGEACEYSSPVVSCEELPHQSYCLKQEWERVKQKFADFITSQDVSEIDNLLERVKQDVTSNQAIASTSTGAQTTTVAEILAGTSR